MTADATDVPSAEVKWTDVLNRCAAAESWSQLQSELYSSGILLSDYVTVLETSEVEEEELLEYGTTEQLRAMLTELVRRDHFVQGAGEHDFWHGIFDEVLAALAFRIGAHYDEPRRVLACPVCGDKERIQTVVFGMPAAMPTVEEETWFYFAGCVDDGTMGDWYCPSDETFHSVPGGNLFEWIEDDTVPDQEDTLTADELGQLLRDITLGRATTVVLDTEAKKRQFLNAQQEVRDIAARGHIVEIPE